MAKKEQKQTDDSSLLLEIPVAEVDPDAGLFRHLQIDFYTSDREDQITIASLKRGLVLAGAKVRKNGLPKLVEDWQDVFRWMVQRLTEQRTEGGA